MALIFLPSLAGHALHVCIHSAPPVPQITALIFLPSFPGWLAPLAFNPVRFLEFFSFTATLLGTWVAAGALFQAAAAVLMCQLRVGCFSFAATLLGTWVAAGEALKLAAAVLNAPCCSATPQAWGQQQVCRC